MFQSETATNTVPSSYLFPNHRQPEQRAAFQVNLIHLTITSQVVYVNC